MDPGTGPSEAFFFNGHIEFKVYGLDLIQDPEVESFVGFKKGSIITNYNYKFRSRVPDVQEGIFRASGRRQKVQDFGSYRAA